ncbi:hypothetical protein [Nocardia sp. NPDC049526]|uniref:hypothetical protein n=1 Tax=Nocardia sp. NPDC049526 TaxID=3364316 RepID=UPI0037A16BD8
MEALPQEALGIAAGGYLALAGAMIAGRPERWPPGVLRRLRQADLAEIAQPSIPRSFARDQRQRRRP